MIAALVLVAACVLPPVPGPIVEPFRAPPCTYCRGHRGVTYAPPAGTPVKAVAGGRVTFAGQVAGTLYVVVAQTDGLTATYGFLRTVAVRRGRSVVAGTTVGASTDRLYFGWKRNGVPVDPTPALMGRPGRPVLVPTDGTRPRVVVGRACAVAGGTR